MKIISQPNIDNWTTKVTCKCTSVLEIDVNDITSSYYEGDCRDPYSYYSYSVTCPVCKSSISIMSKNITEGVRIHLENKAKRTGMASYSQWDR